MLATRTPQRVLSQNTRRIVPTTTNFELASPCVYTLLRKGNNNSVPCTAQHRGPPLILLRLLLLRDLRQGTQLPEDLSTREPEGYHPPDRCRTYPVKGVDERGPSS